MFPEPCSMSVCCIHTMQVKVSDYFTNHDTNSLESTQSEHIGQWATPHPIVTTRPFPSFRKITILSPKKSPRGPDKLPAVITSLDSA